VAFDNLGEYDLPKNWGKEELYAIRWIHEPANTPKTVRRTTSIELPGKLGQTFKVEELLHESKLSQVLLVRRIDDQQQFVLKRVNGNRLPPDLPLWTNSMVRCAHIAFPLQTLADEGSKYELRQYYRGWTLGHIMRANARPICGALYRYWVKEMLSLLTPLHSAQTPIVHRDVHPDNFLVQEDDLSLVLLDLTYSMTERGSRLDTSRIVAPIGYSSTAHSRGEVNTANDVYAVGVIMYRLLTAEQEPPEEGLVALRADTARRRSGRNDGDWPWLLLDTRPETRSRNAIAALSELYATDTVLDHYFGEIHLPDNSSVSMYELKYERLRR
jgi:serine/threonine protein kinase